MNKDERSAASTGADTERHRSHDLNPTSAPALSLPPQRLGSAMEGRPCTYNGGTCTRRGCAAGCHGSGLCAEIEALRQRPGAQAASEPLLEEVRAIRAGMDATHRLHDRSQCVGCGKWNPTRHPEGHGHDDDCTEDARVRGERATRARLDALLSKYATPAGERPEVQRIPAHETADWRRRGDVSKATRPAGERPAQAEPMKLDAAGNPKLPLTPIESLAIEACNLVKAWAESDRRAPFPEEAHMKADAVLMFAAMRREGVQ